MQHDPVRLDETSAWLRKARKDLWRAEMALALDPPDTEDCLFHCQQSAEKALKALLVWLDQRFRKTHDLVELVRQCAELEPALEPAFHGLGPLTRFAWEYRYPGGSPPPSVDQANAWVSKVREVLQAIAGRLPATA